MDSWMVNVKVEVTSSDCRDTFLGSEIIHTRAPAVSNKQTNRIIQMTCFRIGWEIESIESLAQDFGHDNFILMNNHSRRPWLHVL